MALSFKVKAISRSRFLRNIFLSSIFILSFLLIFFSKSDYFIVNKVKSISNSYLHPITSFFVSPVKVISQLQTQFYDFQNLKAKIIVIFTSSEGWILNPKTLIHLVAPFPRTPIISTEINKSNVRVNKT